MAAMIFKQGLEEMLRGMNYNTGGRLIQNQDGSMTIEIDYKQPYSSTIVTGISYTPVTPNADEFKPVKIIYSGDVTICFWNDGTKTMARPSKEDAVLWDGEFGVAMCTMKKIYGTRSQFVKTVRKGYVQKEEK